MKRLFTSLALPLLATTLLLSSCGKVNSDDLEDDVPYYQHYEVSYNGSNSETLAWGWFRVRGSGGAAVTLGNESSLKVNGNATVDNDFLGLAIPTYSWQSTDMVDVTFTLNKKGGKVITNSVPLNSIDPVGFPAMPTNFSRAAGISFNYVGVDGAVEVTIKGHNLAGDPVSVTRTFTTSAVTFTSGDLSAMNNGTIEIRMTRSKTMNIQNADEGIGGEIELEYYVFNSYVLNT